MRGRQDRKEEEAFPVASRTPKEEATNYTAIVTPQESGQPWGWGDRAHHLQYTSVCDSRLPQTGTGPIQL